MSLENGVVVTTDGPFAESKESLIGYWVLDVESEARAIEIASGIVAWAQRSRCARSRTHRSGDMRTNPGVAEGLLRELAPQARLS